MRGISSAAERRLKSRVQAGSDKLQTSLWVSRPTVPLTNPVFLERQKVADGNISKVSVAVAHPRLSQTATHVYVAYIQDGTLKVKAAEYKERMETHTWSNVAFEKQATDVSLCFDGTMPKNVSGQLEFITEQDPWIFWIDEGALYCQKLGSERVTALAESNCQAVSAVRATWSGIDRFNFGLVVFFIISGRLYYRQLFDGVWTDAEWVRFGPSNVMWEDISASRTWDFRIAIQARTTDGEIYELFTQYMGIGTRSAEHFDVNGVNFSGGITPLTYHYHDAKHEAEHSVIERMYKAMPYGGSYELGEPSLVSACNVSDEDGNWGKMVMLVFNKEMNFDSLQSSISHFYIVDSLGVRFYPSRITVDRTGRRVTLRFVDINNASGECTVYYISGSVVTMVGEPLANCNVRFVPKNLIPVDISYPEVVDIWNVDSYGRQVAIRFSEPLITVGVGSENGFLVTVPEYNYFPGGKISTDIKPVESVTRLEGYGDDVILLNFAEESHGVFPNIRNAAGDVFIHYIGDMLTGAEAPVLGFLESFTPKGLIPKLNPNDPEHFVLANTQFNRNFIRIYHSYAKAEAEHFQIAGFSYSQTLTYIDNI